MINKIKVEEDVLTCAFRYALGRKTYIVEYMVKAICDNWYELTDNTRYLIQKEIKEAIENNEAGMKQDVEKWKRILKRGIQ